MIGGYVMQAKAQAQSGMVTAGYPSAASVTPLRTELAYLRRGLDQPGGKLPLFDRRGQEVDALTVNLCIAKGWAEHWFSNPVKPDWLVCRLTPAGRAVVQQYWPGATGGN